MIKNDNMECEMRPTIRYIKDNYVQKNNLIGVEIGIFAGTNSLNILNTLSMKRLYLIDPFEDKSEKMNNCFNLFSERILNNEKYKNIVTFIKKKSFDAFNDISEELDFVYVDGSNNYNEYLDDIEMYYKKIKIGGIIGGQLGWPDNSQDFGRRKAVDYIVKKYKYNISYKENFFPSQRKGGIDWWIIKE